MRAWASLGRATSARSPGPPPVRPSGQGVVVTGPASNVGEVHGKMPDSVNTTLEERDATQATGEKRIVVVEDDPEILASLGEALSVAGYSVETFGDGPHALERLHAGRPAVHLIVLDLTMTGMSGWEFRASQKADTALRHSPVLAISADSSPKAAAIDAARFLRKPLRLTDLLSSVDRILIEAERKRMKLRLD